jgi:hypothetical protein
MLKHTVDDSSATRLSPIAPVLASGICMTAIAAAPALPPDDPHWRETCAQLAALEPPAADQPGATQRAKLAKCDALALYDGVNGPPDHASLAHALMRSSIATATTRRSGPRQY